ncbi:MAG: hypothetical protein ABI551_02355 [Polyangiaceae bacterium]
MLGPRPAVACGSMLLSGSGAAEAEILVAGSFGAGIAEPPHAAVAIAHAVKIIRRGFMGRT